MAREEVGIELADYAVSQQLPSLFDLEESRQRYKKRLFKAKIFFFSMLTISILIVANHIIRSYIALAWD